jgi:two-component system, NtrC family, sensor histidine kinase KinB
MPSLRARILLSFAALLAVLAALVVFALVELQVLGHASDAILRENYHSIEATRQMAAAANAMVIDTRDRAGERSRTDQRFHAALAVARGNITIEGEASLIVAIEKAHLAFLGALDAEGPVAPAHRALLAAIEDLRQTNEGVMYEASARASALTRDYVRATGVAGLLAAVFALFIAVVASGRLVRPLRQLVEAVEHVRAGRYDVAVAVSRDDEIGRLARAFNAMATRIAAEHAAIVASERREKQKSERVLRSIDDAIVVVAQDGKVRDINAAAARLFGVDPRDAVDGPFSALGPGEALSALARARPPAANERPVFPIEIDGKRAFYLASTASIGEDDEPMTVVVLRDVTHLKELDELKSEFVATASHELRTPLTSVSMSLALLAESLADELGPRDRELLEVAEEELARLRRLVEELLDLSKIEAGRIDLEMAPVALGDLVEPLMRTFAAQAADREVRLVAAPTNELPAVRADATKISWVLANLIGNALRYVERGGVVEIGAQAAGPLVEVFVRDDGAGIPPALQERIFDKFVRGAASGRGGGAGLGLAISREIVRAHGGTIWVESEPGRGSTFRFTLPTNARGVATRN